MGSLFEIRLSGVHKTFMNNGERTEVLKDFTYSFHGGDLITLFGPNACGKTTLLHILAAIEDYDSGSIQFKEGHKDHFRKGVAFQDYSGSLYNWLTVEDNIIFPLLSIGGSSEDTLRRELVKFLEERSMGATINILRKYPYEISGGQRQMVSIFRALFMSPQLLLLDEPFSALDIGNRREMQQLLQEYWLEQNNTIIMVSHDLDEALLLGERFLLVAGNPMTILGEWKLSSERPRKAEYIRSEELVKVRTEVVEKLISETGKG